MDYLTNLKKELTLDNKNQSAIRDYLMYLGYKEHYDDPNTIARAYASASLFVNHKKKVFNNDLILGSRYGLLVDQYGVSEAMQRKCNRVIDSYGLRSFAHNSDHYAPDYTDLLENGVSGMLEKINHSMQQHANDPEKLTTLKAMAVTIEAFGTMIAQYGEAALKVAESAEGEQKKQLMIAAEVCQKISTEKPETFREALQFIWMLYVAFCYEWRYAMSLGRLDQYLYPYYESDMKKGTLTRDFARELVACTLYKIGESVYFGGDDVVNIAIGGVKRDGSEGINEVSYIILEAVRDCGIAGPNLSARLHSGMPDEFLDACLQVIGTGIGYPALMNDDVNIAALHRCGYELEDCRNYCMVGCIENFLPGMQPPWSDGRYNSPEYLELALNDGKSWQTGDQIGPHTGDASEIDSMEKFLECLHLQMKAGAAEYMALFRNENDRFNRANYTQPFLSALSSSCIERGLDINQGGMKYGSAHGACAVGIATMADSLAAIEQLVFVEKKVTLAQLRDALAANFSGYEELQQAMLNVPKYGNNEDFVDKYAAWFIEEHAGLFDDYRTPDGGRVYIAIASNVQNISAGKLVAATPDGRKAYEPLSDAASPMHGMDKKGPTAVVLSTTKPDYTKAACGTVLNQKYSPSVFSDPEKRAKLAAMIRVYFARGGQEMQINSVSRETLKDAMVHPENYQSLVVRVSGFSALYVGLARAVQEDILNRTEQE